MHNAALVGVRGGVGNLRAKAQHMCDGHPSMRNQSIEGLAVNELHRDEGASLNLADLVNRANVGMVERGGRAGFSQEKRPGLLVAERVCWQDFEGDIPVEPVIMGAVDHTHPPFTKFGKDFIRAESTVLRKRHDSPWAW